MALASHRSPGPRPADATGGIAVIETIAMKESQRIAHAPGVVAILGSFTPADPRAFEGRGVRIGVLTMIRRNSIC
jgi:hypothetical protein